MAGTSKTSEASSVQESQFNPLNLGEPLQLASQVESHVEPYELVELFYGDHSVSAEDQVNQSTQCTVETPAIVSEHSRKRKTSSTSFKCELCSRVFREASHFSKHKRGALCRKSAQKLAKKGMKRIFKQKEIDEKKNKIVSSPYKPYQCNLCGAKFLDKVNVELHLERTHQTRQPLWLQTSKSGGFACSECELWYVDKAALRQHQLQHSNTTTQAPQLQHNEQPNLILQQSPVPQQSMNLPPHQYYFQPLQHIQTYQQPNHIHQLGLPHSQSPHQAMQQMPPQMGPQGHAGTAFVVPHPHTHQVPTSVPQVTRHQTASSNCVNGIQQHPITSTSSSQSPSNILPAETPKPDGKILKAQNQYNWSSNSRRNICGECGLKFVDPINLELHMQRKHPTSTIVETVGLGGGMTLYKTTSSCPKISANGADGEVCKKNIYNGFSCSLCGFKASTMSNIVKHLQMIHNTNNANFISVNTPNEIETIQDKSSKYARKKLDSKCEEPKCKCDSCSREFDSQADLIRHSTKDKNILCGVCNFYSCSDAKVASHMDISHKESLIHKHQCPFDGRKENAPCQNGNTQAENLPSSPSRSECPLPDRGELNSSGGSTASQSYNKDGEPSPPRLRCCLCNYYAHSGVSLAQHLESHGSITVRCCKCNELSDRFMDINNHINSAHYGEVTRVSITMKTPESPSVYMFMITPTPIYPSGSQEDPESGTENEKNYMEESSQKIHNEEYFLEVDSDECWYACSDCGVPLCGSERLEAHIALHNERITGDEKELSLSCHATTIVSPDRCRANPLTSSQNTLEFRCRECGFWREKSYPVLRHIQAVHMSGNMEHSIRMKSGVVKCLAIRVFTPLSHSVIS